MASIENDHDVTLCDTPDFYNTLLSHICNVLNTAIITEGQHQITIAMLVALQTLMRQVHAGWAKLDDSAVKETNLLIWKLINAPVDSVGAEVQNKEACNVLMAGLEVFYPNTMEKSALLMLLLTEGAPTQLLDYLLTHLADNITSTDPGETAKGRYM